MLVTPTNSFLKTKVRTGLPTKVYLEGNINLLQQSPKIAVIGTREPSFRSRCQTVIITQQLVQHRAVVVSGLAQGIDEAAHSAVLTNGGSTIAVLGTSLLQAYPPQHRELQQYLMEQHLVISQFGPDSIVEPTNFLARNRLLVGMSDAIIVMEAKNRSGTQVAVSAALHYGIPVFMIAPEKGKRCPPWYRKAIQQGAHLISYSYMERLLVSSLDGLFVSCIR